MKGTEMTFGVNSRIVRNTFSVLFGLAAMAAVVGFGFASQDAKAKRTTYKVDSVHSTIVFRINHLGVSNFYGAFPTINGQYTIDYGDLSKSEFEFTVLTQDIDTFNSQRDNHLKSTDFFNAREYTEITFKSTKVEESGDNNLKVTGDLNMHGQTHSITVKVKLFEVKELGPRFGTRSGLDGRTTIKRSKWGMDTYVEQGTLGDDVELMIGVEGQKQ